MSQAQSASFVAVICMLGTNRVIDGDIPGILKTHDYDQAG